MTQQLLLAWMRLAAVLNKLFYTAATRVDFAAITAQQKHGIDAKDAMKYVEKEVTILRARVYCAGIGGDYTDEPGRQISEPVDNGGNIC